MNIYRTKPLNSGGRSAGFLDERSNRLREDGLEHPEQLEQCQPRGVYYEKP